MSRHDLVLRHGEITLRPLAVTDASALRELVDEEMWAGNSVPLPRGEKEMAEHLGGLVETAGTLAFAVERDGRLVGRTTLYDLVPGVRVDIGNTIYGRAEWGGIVNPACKLLLLGHAFEEFGVHRAALRCDHRNARSRGAILRLGARFEGTLRRFRPAADGTIADIDYFSVIREEWPAVRAGLQQRLAR